MLNFAFIFNIPYLCCTTMFCKYQARVTNVNTYHSNPTCHNHSFLRQNFTTETCNENYLNLNSSSFCNCIRDSRHRQILSSNHLSTYVAAYTNGMGAKSIGCGAIHAHAIQLTNIRFAIETRPNLLTGTYAFSHLACHQDSCKILKQS